MAQCKQCRRRKSDKWHGIIEAGKVAKYCDDCWTGTPAEPILVLKDRVEMRAAHWNDIRSRVTTHEGELLYGRAGETYQKRWGKQYLGRDIGNVRPITADRVREYEKTKK